jgi:hypothetical protein
MEVEVMRELTNAELSLVSGGTGQCTQDDSGNNLGGVTDSEGLAQDLINIYESLVAVTSHAIERVAKSF